MSYAGSNFVSQAVQEEIDAEATTRQDADTNLQNLISGLIESKVNLSSLVKQTITNALDIGGNVNIIGGGEFQIDGVPIGGGGGGITASSVDTLTNKTMSGASNTFSNLSISATSGLQTALDNEALTRSQGDSALQTQVDNKVSLFTGSAQTITSGLNVYGDVNLTNGGEFKIDGVPIGGGGGGITASSVDTLTNKTLSADNNTFLNLATAITPYSLFTTQVDQLDFKLNDRLTYYKVGIIQMRLPHSYEGPYVDAGLPFQVPLNIVLDRDGIFPPQLDYQIDPNGADLIIYNAGTYEVSFTVSIEDAGRCRTFFECLTPYGNPTIKIEGNNTYIPSGSFGQMTGNGVFTIVENQSLFKLWIQSNGDGRFNPITDPYGTDEIYATVVIHRLR